MLARSRGRLRLRRLDRRHGRLRREAPSGACRARDRMLDERQCRGLEPGDRVRAAVQSLPAYETHFPEEHPPVARAHEDAGRDRSDARRARPPRRRAHAGGCLMDTLVRTKNAAKTLVPPLPQLLIEPLVRAALVEDLGRAGDLTTD